MRKYIVWLAAFVLLMTTAACSGSSNNNDGGNNQASTSPSATTSEKPSEKPAAATEVEFWYALADANGDVVKDLVDQYNSSQAKYKVVATFVPPGQRMEKLTVALASGETPDLFTAGPPDVATLMGSKHVLSIDELAKNSDRKITKEQFFKPLQGIVVKDGTLYGVPISTGATGLYYNADLFAQYGLTKAPETWEEMIAYAQKLTDPAKDQWGMILPTKEMAYTARMWVTFLREAGGELLNEDATKAIFNSDAGVEALQLWVDLFNKYKVAPLKQMDENTTTQTFAAGKTGMFFGYPAWIVQSKDFPFKTETARPVKKVRRASALGGWYLTVPSRGKNPEGAYDFLSWLVQPDNAVKWNLGMGNSPTTQAAVDTKAYQDFLEANPLAKPFATALAEDAIAPPATGKFNQILSPISKAISLAIFQKATPKEALDKAAQEVDEILAKK